MKSNRISALARGAFAAFGAMALYAVSLGCFIALMLLVISMEEGGESLPSSSLPLMEAIVLLSQGVGFTAGTMVVTIMPLLLSILLVALIAQCARRFGPSLPGWAAGSVVWVALCLILAGGTTVELHDSPFGIAEKAACVWTLGYLLAALPGSGLPSRIRDWGEERMHTLTSTARMAGLVAGVLSAAVLVMSLVVVIVWIVRGWGAMTTLFDYDGMANGSRILTSIVSLAWLPNLMVWSVPWMAGDGFHIGELGTFTLWTGSSAGLPPLPAFGLLPEGVGDGRVRLALQCVVPAIGAVTALLAMLLPGNMRVRPVRPGDMSAARGLVLLMLRHAVALLAGAAACLGAWTLCFLLSDGSLGIHRLSHVGVDVAPAVIALARSLAFGVGAAWLAVSVVLAACYGIHWIVERRAPSPGERRGGDAGSDGTDVDDGTKDAEKTPHVGDGPRAARSIRSERAVRSDAKDRDAVGGQAAPDARRAARTVRSSHETAAPESDGRGVNAHVHAIVHTTKEEESDDNNESPDQEGARLRLP